MQNVNMVWLNRTWDKYCLVKKQNDGKGKHKTLPDTITSDCISSFFWCVESYPRLFHSHFTTSSKDDKSELCMNCTILWLEKLGLTDDFLDTEEALLVDDGLAVHEQHQTRQRVNADATSKHRLVLRVSRRYPHLSRNQTLLNKLG